jgi:hypothetical protein
VLGLRCGLCDPPSEIGIGFGCADRSAHPESTRDLRGLGEAREALSVLVVDLDSHTPIFPSALI